MEFNPHTNHTVTATPSLGSLMTLDGGAIPMTTAMPMAVGAMAPAAMAPAASLMETTPGPLQAAGARPALVRRPSKKEREAEKRGRFYLSAGQGSTNPRYIDWATRFAHNYLANLNRDTLGMFYLDTSTFTFTNTLNTPTSVVCHQGAEAIYGYLQLFRELKQIHLGANGLQIQPMTDNHSITLTLEINIEHQNGSMCHVITTLILQTLPGKKTRRQIGDYQSCQYIQNQFFTVVA